MTKHTPQQFEHDGFNSPREVEVAQARAVEHTPGLVEHDTRGYPHADVRAVSGRKIANTWGTGGNPKSAEAHKKRTDEDRANARRLAACWNACDGIPTEVLEAHRDLIRGAIARATGAHP